MCKWKYGFKRKLPASMCNTFKKVYLLFIFFSVKLNLQFNYQYLFFLNQLIIEPCAMQVNPIPPGGAESARADFNFRELS